MYRGRPPPRGGFPPPFEGRGPRPYPAPAYRDDRARPRPPYHPGYHDHGPPDCYRRSPPRRRYTSPGTGSHRGGEYWAGGPPRERSPSPRGPPPIDHNLVITVGNELTGPPGSAPPRHHDRDYPPRPEYERSRSRGRSRPHSRSPDRSRAKSRGRSKSRARSKSRPRSQSRSPDRSRAKSRGRSRSRSRSPDRSRAKSRGRSQSRSRSPDRSRAKSRGRSKSRHHSRSRSRSRGRSYSRAASRGRSKSRQRGRSASSSSSSSSADDSDDKSRREFRELQTARRRRELEEILNLPTKSILKKRNDSDDSPSLRVSDSSRGPEVSSMSRVADQLLQAVRGMEPHAVASMLSELRSDPQTARRAGLDAEIKEILRLLGGSAGGGAEPRGRAEDIDDEEKFLYGDSEEPEPPPEPELPRHPGPDLYDDVTEEELYGDYAPQSAVYAQAYSLLPGSAPHLQSRPSLSEADARYAGRPTVSPDRNVAVQVPNFTAGAEPREAEHQSMEEYEKIQDLLKTIGLDLGVSEISKMAARTKERLQGNRPPPKTPTRRRRYSSGSSDGGRGRRRRSHSSSSSSSSRSCSRGRGRGSWSSDDGRRKSHKEANAEQSAAAAPPTQTPDLGGLPPHPGVVPAYPPSQVHSMMAPGFPPPGYAQYGNFLPYLHQQWPPMYPPPPNMAPPPHDDFPPTLPYKQYSSPGEPGAEPGATGAGPDSEKAKVSSLERRVSEEQNNESQKQKVLEEREKLKQEREIRMKKKEYLMKELERLRKQQGELLRKKRREKGGHKDPLLAEISRLQEEVMAQISGLRREHESAEKKRNEIEKIALILGLLPTDRPRRTVPPPDDHDHETTAKDGPEAAGSSALKTVAPPPLSSSRASPEEPPPTAVLAPPSSPPPEPFEYYDAGNHWCKNCNVTSGSMFDFFTHSHSKTHRKTLDPYDRPWATTPTKIGKTQPSEEKLTKPAKGSEFLLPVRGFFCLLCRQFFGDAICAEEHVTTHAHNEKYKKQMYENPLYEQRRNLDRQAGLSTDTSGKKRKHEDEDKEDKSKHKKDRKDKEKKKEEAEPENKAEKVKKEEAEPEKPNKKEEESKTGRSQEEDWPSHSKKDEEEKYKTNKKDDEEEKKGKYSRRDEEDRYKHSREDEYRHRYRRDGDDRPKYGPRDDDYKYSRHSDSRSKYDRERDEGKLKAEKEASKKVEPAKSAGKPEVAKPEPPPKPYDPPKIFCGPSPAMRAKLRKQSLEAGKPAPATTTPSFGKFTWKKRENVLAKEAEKVAAEFIKDDEAAAKEAPLSVEDSFAKSMAVAKEIAQKLSGTHPRPPWVSNGTNRGRIRPNLPAPAAVLRKTAMMGKPAPLNTFLSMRTQNPSLLGPVPKEVPSFSDGLAKALIAQNALLANTSKTPSGASGTSGSTPPVSQPAPNEVKIQPPLSSPAPFEVKYPPPVSKPPPFDPKVPPPMSRLPPFDPKYPPPGSSPVLFDPKVPPPMSVPPPFDPKVPPPMSMPPPFDPKVPPPMSRLPPFEVKPAPPVCKPAPLEAKPAPSETPPAAKRAPAAMIKIVSDVAAPGVPESEQIHTVFAKPPPFMNMGDGAQKSDKLKSNLAAAKAKDLFDIFYSGVGQSGASSITKPAADARADESSANKSPLPVPQAPKPQPRTSDKPYRSLHQDPPSPQTQPESDIQIASVWSLQSSPLQAPEAAPSETQQPKPDPPARSEVQKPTEPEPSPQTEPQPKPASQIQTEPLPDLDGRTPPRDTAPEPETKPSPKTRGKAGPAAKRTPPTPRPVRQTRSQTRYQTRQQQSQSQSEPEPASGDSDSTASDSKGLEASGEDRQVEVEPETPGLPSDTTALNFDLNFE